MESVPQSSLGRRGLCRRRLPPYGLRSNLAVPWSEKGMCADCEEEYQPSRGDSQRHSSPVQR